MAEAYGEAGLDDTEEDLSDEESISEEEPEYETSEVVCHFIKYRMHLFFLVVQRL